MSFPAENHSQPFAFATSLDIKLIVVEPAQECNGTKSSPAPSSIQWTPLKLEYRKFNPRATLIFRITCQLPLPEGDQSQNPLEIKAFMQCRVAGQVPAGKAKQGDCRARTLLLDMDKRPRKLNEALVIVAPGLPPDRKPQFFENLMRLKEQPAVEGIKKAGVTGIKPGGGAGRHTGVGRLRRCHEERYAQSPQMQLETKLTSISVFCHSEAMAKPALGRGLGALLGGNPAARTPTAAPVTNPEPSSSTAAESQQRVILASLDRVVPCPFQPRKYFAPEALEELADSIREQGIVQPLIVRERDGKFEIIAGERRWRAAQSIGLKEVPVILREADDRAVLELALIENLQRENLNPLEEAQGYQQLSDQFQLTQELIAVKVGKSRALVANSLRLLKLPLVVQNQLREAKLSVGHAKVLLGLSGAALQSTAADRIVKDALSVRQAEVLVARLQSSASHPADASPVVRDLHLLDLENRLREKLGTRISLRYRDGKGSLEIKFFSDDELDRLLGLLGIDPE